jgi:outer membrane protein OmpA-like peptidoglycan-associated protein
MLFVTSRAAPRVLPLPARAVAVARAREAGMELQQIQLVGHADHTGRAAANMALAQARAETVRDYLLSKGIAPGLIRTAVQGDRQQVSACRTPKRSRAEELEYLLPNRRVEINFVTLRRP